MKIDYSSLPDRSADRAIVARQKARNAAIVRRMKARTCDGPRAIDGSARVRTTDPARNRWLSWKGSGRFRNSHTGDAWLNAEALPKNPDMFGRTPSPWVGDLKAGLDAMSDDELRRYLDARGVRDSGPDDRPEQVFDLSTSATPQDIMDAWASAKHVTNDVAPRDATQAAIQKMQRANDEHWAAATAWQHRPEGEWGKG